MRWMLRAATLLAVGGVVYVLIELLWRGRSHPSMFLVGGLCFVLVGGINDRFGWDMQLALQAAIGTAAIVAVELAAGCVLNLWLGLGVWDYSTLPLNLRGQICVPFLPLWAVLALVAIVLDDVLRWRWFGEERPRYRVGKYVISFG